MYPSLKYIYSATLLAACLMASCNSDAPYGDVTDKGTELTFATVESSRAADAPAFDKFAVYGDMKVPGDNSTNPLVILSNTEVSYANGSWTYKDTQYWFPKHEHSFVAISPATVPGDDASADYSDSRLKFTYTLPSVDGLLQKDEIADIFVSTFRRLYNIGESGLTTLRFQHVMSQIYISAAFDDNILNDNDYILIHQIEFSGIKDRCTYDVTPSELQSNSQTDDRVINISTSQAPSATVTFIEPAPVKVENNRSGVNLFGNNGYIIMIPQDFNVNSDSQITLSFTVNNETTVKQATIPLRNQKWEIGRSYSYRLTIQRTGVIIDDCVIKPWTPVDNDEINVD